MIVTKNCIICGFANTMELRVSNQPQLSRWSRYGGKMHQSGPDNEMDSLSSTGVPSYSKYNVTENRVL